VGIFSHLAFHFLAKPRLFANMSLPARMLLALFFCLPMIADGLLQLFTEYSSTNILRAVTGFLFGFGAYIPLYGKNK
jgi:uncharacterized membrane protein